MITRDRHDLRLLTIPLLVGAAIATGCASETSPIFDATGVVSEDARARLGCASISLDPPEEQMGGDGDDAVGTVLATGCGAAAFYACSYSPRGGGSCTREVVSSLRVGGALYVPIGDPACRSGAGENEAFFGVDTTDANGTSLRIVQNVDRTTTVVVTKKDGTTELSATGCAQSSFSGTTVATRGDVISSVSGSATLDCSLATGSSAVGSISFVDCE